MEKTKKSKTKKISFMDNLSMRKKIMFLSGILVILTLVIGTVGLTLFVRVEREAKYAEYETAELLDRAVKMSRELTKVRANLYISISYGANDDIEKRDTALAEAEKAVAALDATMDEFYAQGERMFVGNLAATKDELDEFILVFDQYIAMYDGVFRNIGAGRYQAAFNILDENADVISITVNDLDSIIDRTEDLMLKNIQTISNSVLTGLYTFIFLLILIVIVTIIVVVYSTKAIEKSIIHVLNNIKYLKDGQFEKIVSSNARDEIGQINRDIVEVSEVLDEMVQDVVNANNQYVDGSLSISIDSTKYKGSYAEMTEVIGYIFTSVFEKLNRLIVTINEMADGVFDGERFEFEGEQKRISDGLFACVDSIISISDKINEVTENANNGILEKVDTTGFSNSWLEILEELNKLVETIGEPIIEVNEVMNNMAEGNLSTQITGDYKGVFNNLKENVNISSESVRNAIRETKESLNQIAENNINFKLENTAHGDFSEIQVSINLIIDRLNEVFEGFQSSSNDVLEVAKQLSNSSQKIANGATEQASTIQELNATVEVINSNTAENAKKASSASEIANKSKENAIRGDEEMKTMLNSMEEIKMASDNIANIIKVIDDIAFQTNLLALNASVEAARAGQHGKGFAVVAEEVRTLAGRSKEAANQTTELINESLQKVNLGNDLANSTAKALHEIVYNIAEVSDLLEDISVSSGDQASSISEILTNLGTFEIVVQNNTNEAEESAESSRHLSEQSSVLKGLIDEFKLLDE